MLILTTIIVNMERAWNERKEVALQSGLDAYFK